MEELLLANSDGMVSFVSELRKELAKRELNVDGSKEMLVARLERVLESDEEAD